MTPPDPMARMSGKDGDGHDALLARVPLCRGGGLTVPRHERQELRHAAPAGDAGEGQPCPDEGRHGIELRRNELTEQNAEQHEAAGGDHAPGAGSRSADCGRAQPAGRPSSRLRCRPRRYRPRSWPPPPAWRRAWRCADRTGSGRWRSDCRRRAWSGFRPGWFLAPWMRSRACSSRPRMSISVAP